MELIYLFLFVFCCVFFVPFRVAVFHPFATVYYAVTDFPKWLFRKNWRLLDGGILNCYGAHFGGGKTLSMAHFITKLYEKKNNKRVWDRGRKKFVTQKLHIISNQSLK